MGKWEANTFCSAVNQWLHTFRILRIHEIYERCIDPTSCFYRIETADDEIELHVVVVVFVLNFSMITFPVSFGEWSLGEGGGCSRSDLYAGNAPHDILRRNSGFCFTYVLLSAGEEYSQDLDETIASTYKRT